MNIKLKRQLRYGTTAISLTIAVVAASILLYILIERRHVRWDFTANREQSLAPQTESVLRELEKPVRITAFFRRGDDLDAVFIRRKVNDVLLEYASRSRKIDYQLVDPDAQLDVSQEYGVTADGTIVFQSGEQRKEVYRSQLFDYANAAEDLPPAFKGEGEFTNAILKVTKGREPHVCLLQGHGERSTADTSPAGLSQLRSALMKNNYAVEDFSFLTSSGVPATCEIVVIAGAENRLPPPEEKILVAWMGQDGRLLLMIEPLKPSPIPETLSLLKITAEPDLVLDPGRHFVLGPQYPAPVLSEDHPITNPIRDTTPILFAARSLTLPEEETPGYTALLTTSKESWGERDLADRPVFNAAHERQGPLVVGVAIDKIMPEAAAKPWALVIGDADFASNSLLQAPGNLDLALNMVGWLSGDKDQVTIRPVTPEFRNLAVTEGKARLITYTTQAVYPLLVLIGGGYYWYRRKNR